MSLKCANLMVRVITLIGGTKLTCWLLLSLWLSFPPKRPSAAPGHPAGCWGPDMIGRDTRSVSKSKGRTQCLRSPSTKGQHTECMPRYCQQSTAQSYFDTHGQREREKVQILTHTVNWRWRWREREKAGKNTENKGGNCQGEQENLRVSFLVRPLILQLAALLTFAHLTEQWPLKIARHPGDGASLSAGHRSHPHLGRVPRFTPLFAVWRARSGRESQLEAAGESYGLWGNMHPLANAALAVAKEEEQPGQMLEVPVTQVEGPQCGVNS